jgi:ABC-type multidrug transport system fused ATPase/permease subunit
VRNADIILVVRAGTLLNVVRLRELMRQRGHFAALYHTQFGEQGRTAPCRVVKEIC